MVNGLPAKLCGPGTRHAGLSVAQRQQTAMTRRSGRTHGTQSQNRPQTSRRIAPRFLIIFCPNSQGSPNTNVSSGFRPAVSAVESVLRKNSWHATTSSVSPLTQIFFPLQLPNLKNKEKTPLIQPGKVMDHHRGTETRRRARKQLFATDGHRWTQINPKTGIVWKPVFTLFHLCLSVSICGNNSSVSSKRASVSQCLRGE